MEKLTVVNNFVKAVDTLRNTECSNKDKLALFNQISDCILSQVMHSHINFSRHSSSAIIVLLLFCEDLDSVVRMNAEENLNKVLRSLETTRLSRILLDLYSEIKKNGNQKSLRICLNLFGYYCPRMKEKNTRWYAIKLIPCIQTISSRKETLAIEALSEFVKTFSRNLQVSLTDTETHRLFNTFLSHISSDCAVKRRCASQNCISLIENSRNKSLMAKHGLNAAVDLLLNEHKQANTIMGVFGFLRLLLPLIIEDDKHKDYRQVIEIYDFAMYELSITNATNHSIINASLEVINAILQSTSKSTMSLEFERILCNHQLEHNEYLKKRKSLKNQIFQLKNVEMTCKEFATLKTQTEAEETIKDACKLKGAVGADIQSHMKIEVNNDSIGEVGANNKNNSKVTRAEQENAEEKCIVVGRRSQELLGNDDDCRNVEDVDNDERNLSRGREQQGDVDDEDGFTTLLKINEPHDNDSHLSGIVQPHSGNVSVADSICDDNENETENDKSQFLSDIDNESFNSIDFESEITIGEHNSGTLKPSTVAISSTSSPRRARRATSSSPAMNSNRAKSSDTIGSFFNNLLAHSNSDTMTKLFRPSSATPSSAGGLLSQPSPISGEHQQIILIQSKAPTISDADMLSLDSSISSHSLGSHVASQSEDLILKNEQDLVMVNTHNTNLRVVQASRTPQDVDIKDDDDNRDDGDDDVSGPSVTAPTAVLLDNARVGDILTDDDEQSPLNDKSQLNITANSALYREGQADNDGNCIKPNIGTIYDQSMVYYTARCIAARFLLSGQSRGLQSDSVTRVSIKSLSLSVISNCVRLMPEVLSLPLGLDNLEENEIELNISDDEFGLDGNKSSGSSYVGQDFDQLDKDDVIAVQPEYSLLQNNYLEIKDDHFGENTSDIYLNLNSPMSMSADPVLVSEESKLSAATARQILSKSEIIESDIQKQPQWQKLKPTKPINQFGTPSIGNHFNWDTLNLSNSKHGICSSPPRLTTNQSIFDILLFHSHSDPILRGNVQVIIGNFIYATFVTSGRKNRGQYIDDEPLTDDVYYSLRIDRLLAILIKGLEDDIHTVVIHALTSFHKIFPLVISKYLTDRNEQIIKIPEIRSTEINKDISRHNDKFRKEDYIVKSDVHDDELLIESLLDTTGMGDNNENCGLGKSAISPKLLLQKLRLCYNNKYWLVQNKYAEVISHLKYDDIRQYFGEDVGGTYENMSLEELLQLVGDDDCRVREHTTECLSRYITQMHPQPSEPSLHGAEKTYHTNFSLIREFLDYRIFQGMSLPLRELFVASSSEPSTKTEQLLAKVLYRMTNKLMRLNDKNLQFGIIYAIKVLMRTFNPVDYNGAWKEFNFDEMCLDFAYHHLELASDLSAQNDILEIAGKLIAANVLSDHINSYNQSIDNLFMHVMKLLNIYFHLFGNQKPILFGKPQKSDLFSNAKEMAALNAIGYFGNDTLYIKLYSVLKSAYDSYKITINQESGFKLMSLLKTCINTISLCFEMKVRSDNSTKIIEEILQYLRIFINYAPIESIACLRQMLKFIFERNYANRFSGYEKLTKLYFNGMGKSETIATIVIDGADNSPTPAASTSKGMQPPAGWKKSNEPVRQEQQPPPINFNNYRYSTNKEKLNNANDSQIFVELFGCAMNFPLGKSRNEEECAKNIKLFEPLVIYCLTLFMKSNATVQAPILDLLSQLLEFNVTYSILDSKCVIFEQVTKNLDLIEAGTARNTTQLIPSIITFLVKLTSQNDKKLITIPKIISIANNLLANNSIKDSSVLALKVLVYELFFIPLSAQPAAPSSAFNTSSSSMYRTEADSEAFPSSPHNPVMTPTTILNAIELNTQKEVVLGMLEKFIDSVECQKMLAILLLWFNNGYESLVQPLPGSPAGPTSQWRVDDERNDQPVKDHPMEISSSIQKDAIYSIVTRALSDGKINVKSWNDFFVLDAIFKNSDKNIRLYTKEFLSILTVFIAKDTETFNNLSYSTIILDNVILKTEEIYLVNHVKLYFQNHNEQPSANTLGYHYVHQHHPYYKQASTSSTVPADVTQLPTPARHYPAPKLNEINYFSELLYVKLDRCFATLTEGPYDGKYSGLAVRFVRALYDVTRMDALNSVLRSALVENEFSDKYQLTDNISNHDYLQVEIFQLFIAMNLYDKATILRKMQTDAVKWTARKTLVGIMCGKYNNPNHWTIMELEVLYSRPFLNALMQDNFGFLQCLSDPNDSGSLLVRAIIDNSDILKLATIPQVLKFLDAARTIHVELKVELLSTIFKMSERTRALQKLIERSLRKVIANEEDKSTIENIFVNLPERNLQLENLLFEESPLHRDEPNFHTHCKQNIIDEKWIISQIIKFSSQRNTEEFVKILFDIKSELKLKKIFASSELDLANIIKPAVDVSFKMMLSSFRNDCIQYSPHINYMTLNPLAKVSLSALIATVEGCCHTSTALPNLAMAVISLMENIKQIEHVGVMYIDGRLIDKFIKDHILKAEYIAILRQFILVSCNLTKSVLQASSRRPTPSDAPTTLTIYTYSKCIDAMLKQKHIWLDLNQPENDRYLNEILDTVFVAMTTSIRNTIFYKRCKVQQILLHSSRQQMANATTNDTNTNISNNVASGKTESVEFWEKALFIGKMIETKVDIDSHANVNDGDNAVVHMIFESAGSEYSSQMGMLNGKPPTIPLEQLSDVDVLHKFVKRLSIFGFTSRHHFEEYFMTFLLLINKVYDENMVDVQEQFQIKRTCLDAILELLITCKSFPIVGNKLSRFHHTTRWSRIKCDTISLKKLHKVHLLVPDSNIFYHPNLERDLSSNIKDNIIGTHNFLPNQYDLNFIWHRMEEYATTSRTSLSTDALQSDAGSRTVVSEWTPPADVLSNETKEDIAIRNFRHFTQSSGIDFKSSSQLIFDVLTQLIEQNHILVLSNLVKFCEICDSRDQIKWIKERVQKLQESIPMDDTISHQHIIFLLCKTQSMLIPSPSELSQLCAHISTYLKSSHVFIRNSTLNGLLCLLECLYKTNTAMGKLSEELSMVREVIVGYINRHGIIEESSISYSDAHTKLVWTLNFSLIEWTTKFVPDCHLLSNTIISANNFLKRTSNEDLYVCILHGLERIILMNIAPTMMRNKIEKIALELVKLENEKFAMPALKLMLSCMYMGSSRQLENTELSNGIVQDDPEIIAQQTDKVDILLHCIKSSTKRAAWIQGQVLCQIIQDLVPPNEILTKVIKEFLAINQPHCDVIARIVYQVFRSAIDSSFLQMLQDWLICSLPTFLSQPTEKGVWCMTVIFLSASINLHLIKLFPAVLYDCDKLGQQEISLFVTSAQDFHSRLNLEQKQRFQEAFKKFQQNKIYAVMLESL